MSTSFRGGRGRSSSSIGAVNCGSSGYAGILEVQQGPTEQAMLQRLSAVAEQSEGRGRCRLAKKFEAHCAKQTN